jgi:hypothetical protein
MAISVALRQLLRIRELEEEQCRLRLEEAVAELRRLEHAAEAAAQWDRRGRGLLAASAHSGQLADRLAGMEESRAATRLTSVLTPRIADEELEVIAMREEFLAKRVERRQAETLIEEAAARDAIEAERRIQQTLDDWHGSRRHRESAQADSEQRAQAPASTSARSASPGSTGPRSTGFEQS